MTRYCAWGERGAGDREVAGSNPANPAAELWPGLSSVQLCFTICLRNPSGRWLGVASAIVAEYHTVG
jgi:hypothetical protein